MVSRIAAVVNPVRVTAGYATLLVVVAITMMTLQPRVQDTVVDQMSTNLHNLLRGHVGTLLGSAFITAGGPIYVWLPGLVCLLAVAELLWRGRWLIMTFALGHIGATLIVAVGLVAAIWLGWMPGSVAEASDVGISYGAAAVLGALTAAIPARFRPAWIGWWLAIGVLIVAVGDDFSDYGHLIAVTLGMLLSTRFRSVARWTPLRCLLLLVGAGFAYLMMVNSELSGTMAPLVGLVGAVVAHWLAVAGKAWWQSRNLHRRPAVRPAAAGQPVLQG